MNIARKQEVVKSSRKQISKQVLCICLLAVTVLLGISLFLVYHHFMYSGCTLKIDEELANPERLLLENITSDVYKTSESYRVTSVLEEIEYNPLKTKIYTINTNFTLEPFHFEVSYMEEDEPATEENTTFSEFSKRHQNMIRSARNLVINYIETSEILTDKETLINEINKIPVLLYTKSTVSTLNRHGVPAQHKPYGIVCSKEYEEIFCEEMFVHELVHHLSYVTNGNQRSRYMGFLFDEVITELITNHIGPKSYPDDWEVDYEYFMYDGINYLSLFGKDAIEAYFYGYEPFFEKYGGETFQCELDTFVGIYGSHDRFESAYELTEAFLGTWYDRLYEN